jgi:predicted dehydrogenase
MTAPLNAPTGTAQAGHGPAGPVRVGIIGAGNVAGQYLPSLLSYPDIEVRGIADLDVGRARDTASAHGLPFAGTVTELLAVDDLELVVNLTVPAAHADVAHAVIESGRHIWGEKPLTIDRESARAVLAAADAAGVAVGNAPDTILGTGIQNSQRLLAAGAIGAPQTVLTLMQGPGPERWHPRPQFLFARGAGPLFDIGPYYLTTLVQLLGPIESVEAAGHRARAERIIASGQDAGTRFPVEVDTHLSVLTRFRSGLVGTSVYSFDSYVSRQAFEITGEHGTMEVPVSGFDGPTRLLREPGGSAWETAAPPGDPRDRGVGVLEMARAIRAGRPPRASGALAFHVLDVLLAIEESAAAGQPVRIISDVGPVMPLDEDWTAGARTLRGTDGDTASGQDVVTGPDVAAGRSQRGAS